MGRFVTSMWPGPAKRGPTDEPHDHGMGVQAVAAGQGGLCRVTGVVGVDADLIAAARGPPSNLSVIPPVQRQAAGDGN